MFNNEILIHILRLFVAWACGFAIGYERKNRSKMAGVRTHAIVACGAALLMIVSKYAFGGDTGDATRIAAQIVSGIGFLGAGTILVMCGDEIYLNDTGSLGPIDAQVQIGRSMGSAHDYMKWVEDKIDEANNNGQLNNFDALMVAQITPNELVGVQNSLDFGKELVTNFLRDYKFKNWEVTETQGNIVDEDLKQKRAEEIADMLADHSQWKSHGRALKIGRLRDDLHLKIEDLVDYPEVCEIVERMQVLLRLIFSSSPSFKIMADKNTKIVRTATEVHSPTNIPDNPPFLRISVVCNNCGKEFNYYINLIGNPLVDQDLQNQGVIPLPEEDVVVCECGVELDLSEIKNNII